MNAVNPKLYLILGVDQCIHHDPVTIVTQAVQGGTTLVQLREKELSTREFLTIAQQLQNTLAAMDVPLLINDRIDIALAARTAGIHIGQEDIPVAEARKILGPYAIIGLTVRSLEEADAAPLELLDYISIGGVFTTQSKHNTEPPIGIDGLQEIVRRLRQETVMPLTAIAGINHDNAADVIQAGVDGVAVISSLCAANSPQQAANELSSIIDSALARRSTP